MSVIQVTIIEGALDIAQKQAVVDRLTDAMVSVEGEGMRAVTRVALRELPMAAWGLGSTPALTATCAAPSQSDAR